MISTHDLSMNSARYARMGVPECKKIHMATLEILERTGVDVHDEQARSILTAGGARGDGIRVRVPEHMVTAALATALGVVFALGSPPIVVGAAFLLGPFTGLLFNWRNET